MDLNKTPKEKETKQYKKRTKCNKYDPKELRTNKKKKDYRLHLYIGQTRQNIKTNRNILIQRNKYRNRKTKNK